MPSRKSFNRPNLVNSRNDSAFERFYSFHDKKTDKVIFRKKMTFREAMDKGEELSALGIVLKQEAY